MDAHQPLYQTLASASNRSWRIEAGETRAFGFVPKCRFALFTWFSSKMAVGYFNLQVPQVSVCGAYVGGLGAFKFPRTAGCEKVGAVRISPRVQGAVRPCPFSGQQWSAHGGVSTGLRRQSRFHTKRMSRLSHSSQSLLDG